MEKDMQIIMNIVKSADENKLLFFDRISLLMDLQLATKEFNLDLDKLLNAPDLDFSHDISGIQRNLNRETKEFENEFLPRYSRN